METVKTVQTVQTVHFFVILHLFSFESLSVPAKAGTITKWADLSEEGDADFAFPMRNGVKLAVDNTKDINIIEKIYISRPNTVESASSPYKITEEYSPNETESNESGVKLVNKQITFSEIQKPITDQLSTDNTKIITFLESFIDAAQKLYNKALSLKISPNTEQMQQLKTSITAAGVIAASGVALPGAIIGGTLVGLKTAINALIPILPTSEKLNAISKQILEKANALIDYLKVPHIDFDPTLLISEAVKAMDAKTPAALDLIPIIAEAVKATDAKTPAALDLIPIINEAVKALNAEKPVVLDPNLIAEAVKATDAKTPAALDLNLIIAEAVKALGALK